jgi:hypothetical protein
MTEKLGERLVFSIFTPNFLLLQTMKSTLIYRGWKMDVSSLMVPNLGP